ncbi:MAG TPA: CBS domain-containing protein [Dehalococcoidia bacterium]|nr:CBS domain-containing protein [Dehalococcoidia bacterium]
MKKVNDIMAQDVVTAEPDMPVPEAAKMMLKEDVGCLVVLSGNKIAGIVTDRDLLACMARGHDIQKCSISNHMTSPVVSVPPDTLLINLAKVMAASQIKRVPITDGGKLLGIISFSDIADDMDDQVADMWSEWLQLVAVTKTSAQHRRGRRFKKQNKSQVKVTH